MDLSQMIVEGANSLVEPMWHFLWVLSTLVGTVYCGFAFLRLIRASRFPGPSQVTFGDILPVLIISGLLANLAVFINSVWNTFGTGTVTYGPISYDGAADFGRLADAINAVLTLASVGGGFYCFRGMLFLKKSCVDGYSTHGSGDYFARAMTHLFGGAALVRIAEMIEAFRQTTHLYW
ncbi:MAG: conjugal transfer protein TraQ [Nitrosomonadales bacterium]|nr:conjugal transfer protein TraQ [Nitrosomonadales bacterium]